MLHACSYTICFVFYYTSWRFYAFFGTNLLTRCHSASSLFYAVFVFQKSYTWNILKIGRNKSRTSYFLPKLYEDRRWDRGGGGRVQPHHQGARPSPWPHPPVVRPPGPPPDAAPSPISSPRREKTKWQISFPRNILQAAAVAVARSGGSRSSSRHSAEEGNPCRRPSTPPSSPPEWCVSSLPWTMGP
jgi:hypothetical protein